jgi:hypothetical protein
MYWAKSTEPIGEVESTESPDYFRMTVWSMAATRNAMSELGMLDLEMDWPNWPEPEDFGFNEEPHRYDQNGSEIQYPAGSSEERFLRDYDRLAYSDRGACIPFLKLVTNDGWLVTPEEIQRSLAIYDRLEGLVPVATGCVGRDHRESVGPRSRDPELEWWSEWIEWLRQAAEHGGFYVY